MADVMITLFNHETQTKQRSYFFVYFVVEKKRPVRFHGGCDDHTF